MTLYDPRTKRRVVFVLRTRGSTPVTHPVPTGLSALRYSGLRFRAATRISPRLSRHAGDPIKISTTVFPKVEQIACQGPARRFGFVAHRVVPCVGVFDFEGRTEARDAWSIENGRFIHGAGE